jgi:hypothetical protein
LPPLPAALDAEHPCGDQLTERPADGIDRTVHWRASNARDGIRQPEVPPNRSSIEYARKAASETSAVITHSGTIAKR